MKRKISILLLTFCLLAGSLIYFGGNASAASFSVAPQSSSGPNQQVFVLTNYGDEDDFTWDGGSAHLANGQSTTIVVNTSSRITIGVSRASTGEAVFAGSLNQYPLTVISLYSGGGSCSYTTTLSMNDGQKRITADASVNVGGVLYECKNNTALVSYGDTQVTFNYTPVQQDPRNVTVYFIDENGYAIGNEAFNIQPNSSATYNVKTALTYNGKNYNLASGQPSSITQAYTNTTASYTVVYQGEAAKAQSPYNISIVYKDAASGNTLTTTSVTVPVGEAISFSTAPTYVTSSYVTYRRVSGEAATITHTSGDSTKSYTVLYDKSAEQLPYNITIKFVDAVSGTVISTITEKVDVKSTVNVSLPGTVNYSGNTYQLASGQGTTVKHSYGDSKTEYYINYNKLGEQDLTPYNITIKYVSVSDNSTLYTTTRQATIGNTISIPAPATYSANGKEYVLLAGQSAATHEFESARRTYTLYFRDINDTTNQNAQVIEQIIQVPGGTEQVVTNVTVPAENASNANPNPGTTNEYDEEGNPIIPDEEVPLEDQPDPVKDTEKETTENTTIDDEETPLANSPLANNSSKGVSPAVYVGIAVAVLAIIGAVVFFILKKKRKQNV